MTRLYAGGRLLLGWGYTLAMNDVTDPADTQPAPQDLATLAGDQPIAQVLVGDVRFTLLGTAHVSKTSADVVERLVASDRFDAVAIELDAARFAAIDDADRWSKMDLFRVLREGKAGLLAVNLALSAFQQRLADQFGIEPGAEMRLAISAAKGRGLPLLLVDRDIGVTLRRVYANVPWWQRFSLVAGLLASSFSREKIDEDEIERLKEGDILEATFDEFAERSERIYVPLIQERDRYMAAKLLQKTGATGAGATPSHREVLVVLGAGHLKGVREVLERAAEDDDERRRVRDGSADLERTPPPSRIVRIVPWLIVAAVLTGFAIGFARSPDFGLRLLTDWTFINAGLAGLGTIIALAHPLTVLATAVAAPFTSLNPLIGAGFVAAGVELWLRKPTVGDFEALRRDVVTLRGWWRNRAARVLLVFLLATFGSAAATYIAGFRIFGRLLG
jgi:pheromone shutdown-related protein TraB